MDSVYRADLENIARDAQQKLNIFCKTKVEDDSIIIAYGKNDFIYLKLYDYDGKYAYLRLRTKDMTAVWNYVPVGFSNLGNGLWADMKRAAHPSFKKNALWYIDSEIRATIGNRLAITNTSINRGYSYKIRLSNGHNVFISLVKNEAEYKKKLGLANIFIVCDRNQKPLFAPMTVQECLIYVLNISLQSDIRVTKFVEKAHSLGGKACTVTSYRLPEESLDKAKALFPNGYGCALSITDKEILLQLYAQDATDVYALDERVFETFDGVLAGIEELSKMPKFDPTEKTKE